MWWRREERVKGVEMEERGGMEGGREEVEERRR